MNKPPNEAFQQAVLSVEQCNPMQAYSKVSHIKFNWTYSQVQVYRIGDSGFQFALLRFKDCITYML